MAPPLVWINGFPGAGKLTVARALLHMIGPDRAVLIDNHQLIDAVAVGMSRDHPEYQAARRLERNRVFTEMAKKSDDHCKVFIFTDFQSDDEVGRAVAPEYQDCASTTGRVFLPIYFHCDLEENKRRVESEERRRSVKTKLQSPQALEGIYSRSSLYQFGVPEELSIDVTSAVPTAVATKIYSHILLHEPGHEEGADERKQSSRQSRKVYQQEAFGNRFETDPSEKNARDDEKSSIVDGNGAASAGGDILEPKVVVQQDVDGILVGSVGLMCFPRLREHQRSH